MIIADIGNDRNGLLQEDWAPGVATAALFQHLGSSEHHEPPQQCHETRYEHPQGTGLCDRLRSLIDSSDPVPAQNTNPTPTSKFDSRDGWLHGARQHTDELRREGHRAPTAWVLTNGHDIPDSAIEGGKEGGNMLYIARAYVEVKLSFAISLMTRYRNLTWTLFDPGRTVYDFPSHTADVGVLVSDVCSQMSGRLESI